MLAIQPALWKHEYVVDRLDILMRICEPRMYDILTQWAEFRGKDDVDPTPDLAWHYLKLASEIAITYGDHLTRDFNEHGYCNVKKWWRDNIAEIACRSDDPMIRDALIEYLQDE